MSTRVHDGRRNVPDAEGSGNVVAMTDSTATAILGGELRNSPSPQQRY